MKEADDRHADTVYSLSVLPEIHNQWDLFILLSKIGPSGLHALHGTKCPLSITFFYFLSLSSLCPGYFSPRRGVIIGLRNFAGAPK